MRQKDKQELQKETEDIIRMIDEIDRGLKQRNREIFISEVNKGIAKLEKLAEESEKAKKRRQ